MIPSINELNQNPPQVWLDNTVPLSADFIQKVRRPEMDAPPSGTQNYTRIQMEGYSALHIFEPDGMATENLPVIVYFHGGGFFAGHPLEDDAFIRPMVDRLKVRVVAVQYHLAPEHPFPKGFNDAINAMKWVFTQQQFRIDRSRVLVVGTSAGGNMAAGVAHWWAVNRPLTPLAGQILIHPGLNFADIATLHEHLPDHFGRYICQPELGTIASAGYLAGYPESVKDCPQYEGYHSPGAKLVPANLCPVYMICGALDFLVLDNIDYARRLLVAGINTRLEIIESEVHMFYTHGTRSAERWLNQFWQNAAEFVRL